MRSPSSRRVLLERALRTVGLVALALLLWRALRPPTPPGAETAAGDGIGAALRRWSTVAVPSAVHVRFDSMPSPATRDWLRALDRNGTLVSWEGRRIVPTAVAVYPVPDPRHPVAIALAGPEGARATVQDAIGTIDTVGTSPSGVRIFAQSVEGAVSALVDGTVATAARRDSLEIRPLLVLGSASWETKFVIAALEERGWRVDARVQVAPGVEVTRGTPSAPDTARYSAVIVVDSSAASQGAAIARFVRAGGGAVIAGTAVRVPALRALLPGAPGAVVPERPATRGDSAARLQLALTPVVGLRDDAVSLEQRAGHVAVAARRVGRGRVLQVGYADTWKWRLAGDAEPVDEHRRWWARAVSAVAFSPAHALPAGDPLDPAPMTSLVDALGMPGGAADAPPADRPDVDAWLFALCLATLLGEWSSRRLRAAA